jgi:hypothetical protein
MGIRNKPTAPASPWQNGFVERLIGSIRRECVDLIIVLSEAHLRRILKSYARYYNETLRAWPGIRTRPFLARFGEPVWSGHLPSWADFITATPRLKFSATTPVALANYSNPELDRLLEHAWETVDTEKRSRTTAFRHFRMSC